MLENRLEFLAGKQPEMSRKRRRIAAPGVQWRGSQSGIASLLCRIRTQGSPAGMPLNPVDCGFSDRCGRQALSRARPLARRALITARPPRVLIRARNPWVRFRFRLLGWNVRFMAKSRVVQKGCGIYPVYIAISRFKGRRTCRFLPPACTTDERHPGSDRDTPPV